MSSRYRIGSSILAINARFHEKNRNNVLQMNSRIIGIDFPAKYYKTSLVTDWLQKDPYALLWEDYNIFIHHYNSIRKKRKYHEYVINVIDKYQKVAYTLGYSIDVSNYSEILQNYFVTSILGLDDCTLMACSHALFVREKVFLNVIVFTFKIYSKNMEPIVLEVRYKSIYDLVRDNMHTFTVLLMSCLASYILDKGVGNIDLDFIKKVLWNLLGGAEEISKQSRDYTINDVFKLNNEYRFHFSNNNTFVFLYLDKSSGKLWRYIGFVTNLINVTKLERYQQVVLNKSYPFKNYSYKLPAIDFQKSISGIYYQFIISQDSRHAMEIIGHNTMLHRVSKYNIEPMIYESAYLSRLLKSEGQISDIHKFIFANERLLVFSGRFNDNRFVRLPYFLIKITPNATENTLNKNLLVYKDMSEYYQEYNTSITGYVNESTRIFIDKKRGEFYELEAHEVLHDSSQGIIAAIKRRGNYALECATYKVDNSFRVLNLLSKQTYDYSKLCDEDREIQLHFLGSYLIAKCRNHILIHDVYGLQYKISITRSNIVKSVNYDMGDFYFSDIQFVDYWPEKDAIMLNIEISRPYATKDKRLDMVLLIYKENDKVKIIDGIRRSPPDTKYKHLLLFSNTKALRTGARERNYYENLFYFFSLPSKQLKDYGIVLINKHNLEYNVIDVATYKICFYLDEYFGIYRPFGRLNKFEYSTEFYKYLIAMPAKSQKSIRRASEYVLFYDGKILNLISQEPYYYNPSSNELYVRYVKEYNMPVFNVNSISPVDVLVLGNTSYNRYFLFCETDNQA